MYPVEYDASKLKFELPVFKGTAEVISLIMAKEAYYGVDTACRKMFSKVYVLLKHALVCPLPSYECEQSVLLYIT